MRSTVHARRNWLAGLFLALTIAGTALPVQAASGAADVMAVTASSTDGMLMDAVDDDPSTFWQNKAGGEPSAWLAVRLATPARLRAVSLLTGPMAAGVTFDIETSVDGDSYRTVLKAQHIGQAGVVELPFGQALDALYVRVNFHYNGSGPAPRFRIAELKALSE